MKLVRRLTALAAGSLATSLALVLAPTSAQALVVPDAAVKVTYVLGGFQFCFTGDADPSLFVTGAWHVELDGWRDDNALVGAGFPLIFGGRTLNVCANVYKSRTWRGAVVGTVTYVGAGIDVTSTVEGYALWSPETGDRTGDGQTF